MKPAALLLLFVLASCATPPPASNGGADVVMDGLIANATATGAASSISATSIAQAAEQATRATLAQVEETRIAYQATATAGPVQTRDAQRIEQAAAIANNESQIKLDAMATRAVINTNATREASQLAIDTAGYDATRHDIVVGVSWVAFFTFVFFGSIVLFKILLFKHRTVIANNGDPIVVNGKIQEYEEEPDTAPAPRPRTMRFTPRSGENVDIEIGGESFELRRPNSLINVYTFNDDNLHAMRLNIERGDIGFRRKESATDAADGLQELIGLTDRKKYTQILEAMKENQWVRSAGNANKWTEYGAREVLGMDGLPQQNTAL